MKLSVNTIGTHHITFVLSVIAALSASLTLVINIRDPELFRSVSDANCIRLSSECDDTNSAGSTRALRPGYDFQSSNLLRAGLTVHSPFRTVGCSSHAFVVTAAYRGGPARWTIVGLQPSHIYRYTPNTASFQCEWMDGARSGPVNATRASRVNFEKPGGLMFPHTYITIVVICDFSTPVGTDGGGGAIVLRVLGPRVGSAAWGWSGEVEEDEWMYSQLREVYTRHGTINAALVQAFSGLMNSDQDDHASAAATDHDGSTDSGPDQAAAHGLAVVAGTERPRAYDAGQFQRVVYENLYCGSSIYGKLDVLALNEWLSYHLYLFGPDKTHFVFYDAGAVQGNKDVEKALEHWIRLGLLTINQLQEVQMYPGYYHHQHHAINDCLNRYRFMAKQIWFMDVDEYIIVKPPNTLHSIIQKYQDQDVLMFKQHKFSDKLCRRLPSQTSPQGSQEPQRSTSHQEMDMDAAGVDDAWTMERLKFSKAPDSIAERKYVVLNPSNSRIRSVLVHAATTGKHHHVQELDLDTEAGFYHYHDTITKNKAQLCGTWLPPNTVHAKANSTPHTEVLYDWYYDDAILPLAAAAKTFIRNYFAQRNITSLV